MNDPIERQEAIDAIRNEFKKSPTTAIRAMEVLKGLPPAQPSPCEFCEHNDISDNVACLRCSAERREE